MTHMTKTKLIKAALFLVIVNSYMISACFAEDDDVRYYDVEIIIFENTTPKYSQSEFWKKNYIQVEPETYVQIGQPLTVALPEKYNPLLSFQYIESESYRLNDIATNLNESNRHRVLLHSAWRQPGLSKDEAINVKIDHFIPTVNNIDNEQLTTDENNIDDKQISTNEYNLNASSDEEATPENKGYVLSGYIKLILSRYLHLKFDLIYHELKEESAELFISDEFGEDNLLPDVFHLLQQRRLRSKELHYIDHPVISIVTLITPYKIIK